MGRIMHVTDDLGAHMRAARVGRAIGLRELAQRVGMSPSSLSEFEHGKSRPAVGRLEALARALELPLDLTPPDVPEIWFRHWRDFDVVELDPVTEAALDIFTRSGYEAATMRMIAERCGLSISGIYYYAKSKQELLKRMLDRGIQEVFERCSAAVAEGATPEQQLANLTECVVRFHVYRRPWAILAETELRSLDEVDRLKLVESRRAVRRMFQAAVSDIRRSSEAEVDPEACGRAIVTMCVAVASWFEDSQMDSPDELVRQYVALAHAMATT